MWYCANDYKSNVGVELDIYQEASGELIVTTRSRAGRSYWDLSHQNHTIKTLKALFGGYFKTDAGQNRYDHPDEPPPSPLASGCFHARWRFHNDLLRTQIYLQNRNLEGPTAKDKPSPLGFMDEYNPRLLFNNLLLPYGIAIWEEYFRSTFAATLKYAPNRDQVFKRVRLGVDELNSISQGRLPVERAIAECFSFQRPSNISENFKMIDLKLDIAAALRKPYRKRKQSLFESIECLVEDRNELVHTGTMNLKLFDSRLNTALSDLEIAVTRAYDYIARHFEFTPNHDY
jgi:hypothetical protein